MSSHETELEQLCDQVESLVTAASELRVDDMDTATVERIGLVIADTLGVTIAGARSPEIAGLVEHEAVGPLSRDPLPGRASSVVVPGGRYADTATAAWLNGSAVTFLELDEGVRPTGHPAAHVVAAAVAAAERHRVPGTILIEAVAGGYEIAARLFEAFALPAPMHPHGHFGTLAAAAAVARILDVNPIPAVRVAATQPLLTSWHACYAGATARNTWTGHANRVGVLSHAMTQAGFTGTLQSFLSLVSDSLADPTVLEAPVDGTQLAVTRNYFKRHSACALTLSSIDAALTAYGRLTTRSYERIREVHVWTTTRNMHVARQAERNSLSTRFSIPYAVATALMHGDARPSAFEWTPQAADFASRVIVTPEPGMDDMWPESAPSRVRIVTDEESVEETVMNPRGHHTNPVGRGELADKFVQLVHASIADPGVPDTEVHRRALGSFNSLVNVASLVDCSEMSLPHGH